VIQPDMPTTAALIQFSTAPAMHTTHILTAAWVSLAGTAWGAWLLYLPGAITLAVGLITLARKDFAVKPGLDGVVAMGPVLLAAPIAVFGAEHFEFSAIVAGMVPAWIPGHLFWALLVGVCLMGAGLSIASRKYAGPTAGLLGIMICLFVLLIHIPGILGTPKERLPWVVGLRDLAFAGGAFAVAAAYGEGWTAEFRHRLVTIARLFVGVPIVFLGVQHFLHPEAAPGVPLAKLMPPWLPLHSLWAFLAGAVFVVAGVCLIINKEVRPAATWLGLTILLIEFVVYVPIAVAHPTDVANSLNYLADTLLLAGSVLSLANAATWDFLSRARAPMTEELVNLYR
jgi:uncharacterized membrane protein